MRVVNVVRKRRPWEVDVDASNLLEFWRLMKSMSIAGLTLKDALSRTAAHLGGGRLSSATRDILRLFEAGKHPIVEKKFLKAYPDLGDGMFLRGLYDLREHWPFEVNEEPRGDGDDPGYHCETPGAFETPVVMSPTSIIEGFIEYYESQVPELPEQLRKFNEYRVILEFTRQLRARFKAGDLALPACREAETRMMTRYPIFRSGIGYLCDELETGATLGQAIAPHTSVFPAWYVREVLEAEQERRGWVRLFDRLLGVEDDRYSF